MLTHENEQGATQRTIQPDGTIGDEAITPNAQERAVSEQLDLFNAPPTLRGQIAMGTDP